MWGDAFENGMTVEEVHNLTHIDPWFLVQIKDIVDEEMRLDDMNLADIDADEMLRLKRKGFSDAVSPSCSRPTRPPWRNARHALKVRPVYKRVDTCAAEFATRTAYM